MGRKAKDLSGQKFGMLTAQYATEKRDKRGSVYWHCVCDCGNEVDVTAAGLVHGNYHSCGCLQKKNRQEIAQRRHLVDGTCVEVLEKRKSRKDNMSGFRGVFQLKNLYEKIVSNMMECKSRGAYLMGVTNYGNYEMEDKVDFTVYVPKVDEHFMGSLAVIPLQLLGYYVSVAKGLDVDKPRNLAKSVTVE